MKQLFKVLYVCETMHDSEPHPLLCLLPNQATCSELVKCDGAFRSQVSQICSRL